jgi:hypothetical protein
LLNIVEISNSTPYIACLRTHSGGRFFLSDHPPEKTSHAGGQPNGNDVIAGCGKHQDFSPGKINSLWKIFCGKFDSPIIQ